jgi:hypothetical protein
MDHTLTDIKKGSCIRFDTEQGRLCQIADGTITQTNVAIASGFRLRRCGGLRGGWSGHEP